jgi:multidrug efflux pump subunit AcrA (membrane-fusion protein)
MKKLLILSSCLFFAACSSKEEAPPAPLVNVRVAQAELLDVHLSVRAPATIFPRQQAGVAARITAPIRTLRAHKGDAVQAGQLLAELDDTDLLAQRREAAAAAADAEANLQKISAGTLPTDVERARGQVAMAEAALNQAQKVYDRRSELFKEGAIPGRDLLVSQTDLAQAKTAHEVAVKSLDLLLNQSRDNDIRMAKSRLEQARAHLDLIDAQLQFSKLRSPFAGTVVEQFLYPGDMAKPDAPILTIMDMSVAVARAQVPESETAGLKLAQECRFVPVDSQGPGYLGQLTVVNRSVDPARRTVEVWCEIPKPDRELRAGVFGNLTILVATIPGSVVVPLPAIQFAEGTRKGVAMVVDEKKIAHKREVEAGETFEDKVRIIRGLKPGETVVVEGNYGLPEGTQVRIPEEKKP